MGHGEEDVADDHDEDRCCQHVVDKGRPGTPVERKEPNPLQDDPGAEHHGDRTGDEERVQLLSWVELVELREWLSPESLAASGSLLASTC